MHIHFIYKYIYDINYEIDCLLIRRPCVLSFSIAVNHMRNFMSALDYENRRFFCLAVRLQNET